MIIDQLSISNAAHDLFQIAKIAKEKKNCSKCSNALCKQRRWRWPHQ